MGMEPVGRKAVRDDRRPVDRLTIGKDRGAGSRRRPCCGRRILLHRPHGPESGVGTLKGLARQVCRHGGGGGSRVLEIGCRTASTGLTGNNPGADLPHGDGKRRRPRRQEKDPGEENGENPQARMKG